MVPNSVENADPSRPVVLLIVEDDVLIRAATTSYLRGVGYEVLEAVNVEQAEGILGSRPDVGLVFCDVKLPGERSGFDLLEVIRQDFPLVKVLFASGVIKAEEAARDGVPFLRKPYILLEVQRRIEALLAPDPDSASGSSRTS